MVIVGGGPHRLREPADEAIEIETEEVIGHMVAIVEAEVDLEVHGGIGHHSLEVLLAEK